MFKDFLIALSLSNLCFIHAWRRLLTPSSSFYYYHQKSPPPPADYAALVLDVMLVAGLFFVCARLARRARGAAVRRFARATFLLTLAVPLHGLLSQFDRPVVRRLLEPLAGGEPAARRLLVLLPLLVALAVVAFAMLRPERAVRVASALLLILAPLAAVIFPQAALTARNYRQSDAAGAAAPLARGDAPARPRVVWLVFDEMDFRMAFEARPPSVQLPELDRLVGQSLSASRAYPPARETFLAMPALTTGRLVSEASRRGPDELMIRFGDDTEAVPWGAQPNVFTRAREHGFDTALVGWYHPYCRILDRSLTTCAWEGSVPFANLARGDDGGPSRGLAHYMLAHADRAARTIPLVDLLLPKRVDLGELDRKKHVADYESIRRQAIEAATNPGLGLVMVHWPIPHPPNIYARSEDRLTAAPGRSYLDNLELADRTVGDLRRAMEAGGTWDDSTVLITSDHWWRGESLWKKHRGWTAEDEATAAGAEADRRVPFILKLSGGTRGSYAEPFNTVLTHDLLLAILRGEVNDTAGAARWLDRHRSIGRSPYDDRSSRDDL